MSDHLQMVILHSCTGTAPGILVTRTRRFPAPGSLGAGMKRPLFDGSFLGNLGAFQGAFWELAFAAPLLLGACRSSLSVWEL